MINQPKFIQKFFACPQAEVFFVVFCVILVEWIILPFTRSPFVIALPIVAAVVIIFLSHRGRGESVTELGWRFDNFFECLKLLALPMLVVTAFLTFIGWRFESLRFGDLFGVLLYKKYLLLFVWGLVQQHALQAFFNRRLQEIWGRGFSSVLAAATIFALLHLPNLWLTVATFCGGLLWATVYQRVPNLFALALSHGLMSTVLVATLPPWALHGMRVGYNYFRL